MRSYNYSNELYHHGILGMKWGVRRFQNKDGTLTNAGKKRKRQDVDVHEDYKKAHDSKSVKSMSDAELRARNNRLQMERQYADMTKKSSRGMKVVKSLITVASTITAAEAAYKTYKRLGNNVLDKIGDWAIKDLNKGLQKGW